MCLAHRRLLPVQGDDDVGVAVDAHAPQPGGTTMVASCSSMMAGPANAIAWLEPVAVVDRRLAEAALGLGEVDRTRALLCAVVIPLVLLLPGQFEGSRGISRDQVPVAALRASGWTAHGHRPRCSRAEGCFDPIDVAILDRGPTGNSVRSS